MVHPIHKRFTLRCQAGDHERCRGPQVGRHHRRTDQFVYAFDESRVTFGLDRPRPNDSVLARA